MIQGIHHVTALAGHPTRHLKFYRETLGLELLALTVNRDDPGVCHLIYGPLEGPWLTFLMMPKAHRAVEGFGRVGCVVLGVAPGALSGWQRKLRRRVEGFDGEGLVVRDPDGLRLRLVEVDDQTEAPLGVELEVADPVLTREFMKEELGCVPEGLEVRKSSSSSAAQPGCGGVHHLALRCCSLPPEQPVWDSHFFRSVYLREPGGVLLELATEARGLRADGGRALQLPPDLEPRRAEIEAVMPNLTL